MLMDKNRMSARGYGFTIVELLIVIVVIGILAAVTVVAYTGIQRRAANVSIISSAKQTMSMIQSYMTLNGEYPATGGYRPTSVASYYSCVTTESGCSRVGEDYPANPVFDTAMASVGSVPKTTRAKSEQNGIIYVYKEGRTLDGKPNPALLVYYLEGGGQTDCGNVGTMTNGIYDEAVTVDRNFSIAHPDSDFTSCVVAIPPL